MSDYPNMSYCMFQNTLMAMEQLTDFLAHAEGEDLTDIRSEELRAMQALFNQCESFINLADDFDQRRQQVLDACEDDAMEEC
jgi:hypothetical protein